MISLPPAEQNNGAGTIHWRQEAKLLNQAIT